MTHAPRCPICNGHDNRTKQCHKCETWYHNDCWEYNDGCGIYGCQTRAATPIEFYGHSFLIQDDTSSIQNLGYLVIQSLLHRRIELSARQFLFLIMDLFCLTVVIAILGTVAWMIAAFIFDLDRCTLL